MKLSVLTNLFGDISLEEALVKFEKLGIEAVDVFPIYPVGLVVNVDDVSVGNRRIMLIDGNVGGGVEVKVLMIGVG